MTPRTDWTVATAAAAIACLSAMFATTLVTGVSQEQFELVRPAAAYAADLQAHGTAARVVFALDTVFLVLYAAFFLSFGRRIATDATRPMIAIAIGAMLTTAALDIVEDHHILAMLSSTEAGAPPGAGEIAFQHTLSQVKFNISYLGLFLFGLAVPRTHRAGTALALLLTVGTLAQGAILYAAPLEAQGIGSMGRWCGFIAGFALAIAVVRAADADRRLASRGSGAPA